MQNKIKAGDNATIKWTGAPPEPIIILNLPRGEGDLVQVEYLNGLVQAFSATRTDYVIEKQRE